MCNDYRLEVDIASIAEDFDNLQIKLDAPDGMPNVPSREDIKITDVAPVVRSGERRGIGELVNRRWSWPGQGGRPVYNFRSEGRAFASHRCLVLCDGFYEFTDPADKAQKRLDKWLFTMKGHRWFCMAGIWREHEDGEAFTLLTMDAGPDIAPYHHRQIIPLARDKWADWLDPDVPAEQVLEWLPGAVLKSRKFMERRRRKGHCNYDGDESLQRFVEAQEPIYSQALDEIRRGAKRSHWMWFIFPQLAGLGRSDMARRFAIEDGAEAKAYLAHPLLGARYIECVETLQDRTDSDPVAVFGKIDAVKLRSSLTLFEAVSGRPLFTAALSRWFAGEHDPLTLEKLGSGDAH